MNATCPTRGAPTPVILPNWAELKVVFGFPGFAWLMALKNSPRNCNFQRSANVKFLHSPASIPIDPGPLGAPLPIFSEGAVGEQGSARVPWTRECRRIEP